MEITFLGTGTSQGVPVIGCDCGTCRSSDSKDNRLRTSLYISIYNHHIIIDVSPDFRQQMLSNRISDLDVILLTHEHNDHIIGMDDVRPINFKHRKVIPIYSLKRVLAAVKKNFYYAFEENIYPGSPKLKCLNINSGVPFFLFEEKIEVIPLMVYHGELEILGFRIQNFAYITDASHLPEETMEQLKDVEVLVINALQKKKHFSHFSVKEALDILNILKPKKAYLTHLSHHIGNHENFITELPPNVLPAYDKLKIKI
ncbi:MAG: MBL fold metallo-hydrolase [Saprospiraceae bacterium]